MTPETNLSPPPGALPSPLPETLTPALATLVDATPANPSEWIFEVKWDGYRLLTRIDREVRFYTRGGHDWTPKLAPLRAAVEQLNLPAGWYDGEIVVLNEKGISDFGALQNAFDDAHPKDVVYCVFDTPYFNGYDMREVPLEARREVLQAALAHSASSLVHFSETFHASTDSIVETACELGLEGVVAKRKTSAYRSTRSADWIKLKCTHRQEFVIGGWTDPKGSRSGVGALLLGVYDPDGQLRYAGNVGSGFDFSTLETVHAKLDHVANPTSPFKTGSAISGTPHWVTPSLVAEITFSEWTTGGLVRHAVFHGLREDKDPKTIIHELAASLPRLLAAQLPKKPRAASKAFDATTTARISPRVTSPDRTVDETTGITKLEVVQYYAQVAPLMMEHLADRPVTFVRVPAGLNGPHIFQKHAEVEHLPGVVQLPQALEESHPPMLEVARLEGLRAAAQWNVLEFHTQNTRGADYEHPDRIVFDLDPGDGVDWAMIQHGADVVRRFVEGLYLTAFAKTSGGGGVHVVIPLESGATWDELHDFAQGVTDRLAATLPELFVSKSGSKNRVGRIFVDWLRNGRGSTTACAWSARARPGLGVSVPVAWDELPGLTGGAHWTIRNVGPRLDVGNLPWKGYDKAAKSLATAAHALKSAP